jgi:glycosyltransferase involved in cell wall biosynthesis
VVATPFPSNREAVEEGESGLLVPAESAAALAAALVALLADPARRRAMSARGRALVDGFGAARAAEVVLERRGRPRVPEGQEAPR